MILVFGDLNVDVSARLASPIAIGQDCPSDSLSFHCGGVGGNVALALARLGTRAKLLGCAGKDWFGDHLVSHLAERGVDVSHVRRTGTSMSGLMFIAVGPDGQRTIFGSRGANNESPEAPPSCLDEVTAVEIAGYAFLSPATAEFAEDLLRRAQAKGLWTTLDIGSAPSMHPPGALLRATRSANTVFANAGEALLITGARDMEQAFTRLEDNGCQVVLKLGSQGCRLRIDGDSKLVPAFPVEVVDTTGAGDAFTAAFLSAHSWGWPAALCAVFANAAGAAATTMMGAGENMPGLGQIRALVRTSNMGSDWELLRCDVIRRLENRA